MEPYTDKVYAIRVIAFLIPFVVHLSNGGNKDIDTEHTQGYSHKFFVLFVLLLSQSQFCTYSHVLFTHIHWGGVAGIGATMFQSGLRLESSPNDVCYYFISAKRNIIPFPRGITVCVQNGVGHLTVMRVRHSIFDNIHTANWK